jgi:TonB family protein
MEKKTQTTFVPWLPRAPWAKDPDGCSAVTANRERLILKPGTRITVRYFAPDGQHRVRSIAKEGEMTSRFGAYSSDMSRPGNYVVPPPPVCLRCPAPPYTPDARSARIEGRVLLEITILPDGTTSDVKVIRSLDPGLDASAVKTVRNWRFKPVPGPVPTTISVELNFRPAGR